MTAGALPWVDAARLLESRLEEIGLHGWSRRLEDTIGAATTGGELVMSLRWNVRVLLESNDGLPNDVKELGARIIKLIDDTGW